MKKFIFGSLFVAALVLGGASAMAATTVVTPGDMQGWGFLQETPTGSGSIVAGPAGGLGDGSANLIVDSTGGVIVGKSAYAGTELSDFTTLEYSTYRTSGGPALAIALQFNFDGDVTDLNDAWQGRLVYEPYHTQTVSTGAWETWDALDDAAGSGTGNWWFSNGTHATNSGCAMATPCTWAEVLAAFPNGGVHNTLGAVILKAGSGWTGGFDGNVDALTIGVSGSDTTFDFDPDEVDTDTDDDGVENDDDLCPGTEADSFGSFGKSKGRYQWNGSAWVATDKGAAKFAPDMEYTYGCSGEQILDSMSETTGGDFGGHYKYGVTKSILEEWHEGLYPIETVNVPANDEDGVSSIANLLSGEDYVLEASGTAYACNEPGCVIEFDAEYSTSDASTWVDGVAAPYDGLGPNLLDLMIDGGFVNWDTDATYDADHAYSYEIAGAGAPVTFGVYDTFAANNTGALTVDISVKLW